MLKQILDILRSRQGVVSVRELAQALQAQPSAVEGMLQELVRMGKLRYESGHAEGETCVTCSGCGGAEDCPVLFYVPRRLQLVEKDPTKPAEL